MLRVMDGATVVDFALLEPGFCVFKILYIKACIADSFPLPYL